MANPDERWITTSKYSSDSLTYLEARESRIVDSHLRRALEKPRCWTNRRRVETADRSKIQTLKITLENTRRNSAKDDIIRKKEEEKGKLSFLGRFDDTAK